MTADLKDTPTAGLDAQLCGDAHPSNFGAFASPERRLLFDLNDFDEHRPSRVGTQAFIVLLQGATRTTRCSSRLRRRPSRRWKNTWERERTSSTVSGWCRASG
jgi:hypothetical protein